MGGGKVWASPACRLRYSDTVTHHTAHQHHLCLAPKPHCRLTAPGARTYRKQYNTSCCSAPATTHTVPRCAVSSAHPWGVDSFDLPAQA
ncbi:hypothetical protein E2C01_027820 [Portunus trituberculatus]|uniref:Uncharacterized protein n=1 Tax=Portunus trituberculatus TaxID=210409 RepID=A0A5B7EMP0_PORTR|nr:hypothetical protein [Portunus trituberculatus]